MAQPAKKANLFPIKAHYCLFYAGTAPVILFLPTYARQLGFSTILVGSIYTILPLVGMTARLILGNMADRLQNHKRLLMLCVMLATVSMFSLKYVPPSEKRIRMELECTGLGSFVKTCSPDTREDRCLLSKFRTEHENSSSLYCTMECTSRLGFIYELCSVMQGEPQHCKQLSNHLTPFGNGESAYAYRNILKQEDENSQPSLRPMGLENLTISAHLETESMLKVDGCLLFTVGKIKDTHSYNETWYDPICSSLHSSECHMSCNSSTLMDTGEMFEGGVFSVSREYWMLLAILVFAWIGNAPVSCIGDTICYGLLGDSPLKYGKQRMWGSLGWGAMATVAGLVVDNFSKDQNNKNYSPIFYLALLFLVSDMLMISRIETIETKKPEAIMTDIGKLLLDFRIVVFILWVIAVGFFFSMLNSFLFWHIEDLAGCKDQDWVKTLQGLYISVSCIGGECPFFFINDVIRKKLGHNNVMTLVLFMMGTMYLLFSLIENPWWFLPVGIINGFLYSTFYSTMTSYASYISTPGTKASVQGIFGSAYEGIGGTSGNFIAGSLFYYMERKAAFRLYFCAAFVLCFLHLCVRYLMGKSDDDQSTNKTAITNTNHSKNADCNGSSCYVISQ